MNDFDIKDMIRYSVMFVSFFLVAASFFLQLIVDPIKWGKMTFITFFCVIPFFITIILGILWYSFGETGRIRGYYLVRSTFLFSWVLITGFFIFFIVANSNMLRELDTLLKLGIGVFAAILIVIGSQLIISGVNNYEWALKLNRKLAFVIIGAVLVSVAIWLSVSLL